MTKKKKITISIIAIMCALIVGLGAFFGIRIYLKNMIVKEDFTGCLMRIIN